MYKVVKKGEAVERKVADNKTAFNLITKEVTPDVSLAVIEAHDYEEDIIAEYNWIYYIIEVQMTLTFGEKEYQLEAGDSCYISKGQKFKMQGTFRYVIVNQPAFGT